LTVTVNGVQAGAANSNAVQQWLTHEKTRAWYCSAWIGGNPLTSITHQSAALQKHPMFWQQATPSITNFNATQQAGLQQWASNLGLVFQPYASDTYTPWCTGRGSLRNQQGTGETTRGFVGQLNGWECDYLITGDKRVANSVIQNGYTFLTRHLSWRDSATGACLITSAQLQGRQQLSGESSPAIGSAAYFPSVFHNRNLDASGNNVNSNNYANFEMSHQPCAPLMPFMLRPSPVFIEIAQKIAVFNHTFGTSTGELNSTITAWRGACAIPGSHVSSPQIRRRVRWRGRPACAPS
jgi:hypothetical protein